MIEAVPVRNCLWDWQPSFQTHAEWTIVDSNSKDEGDIKMKATRVIAVATLMMAIVCAAQWNDSTAQASEPSFASSAVVIASVAGDGGHEYLGSKSCKMCHIKTYKSWEDTPHAKALESLKPGNAAEEKTKHDLDPEKDYSTDTACLKCHVVGLGSPGGYEVPDPEDKKSVKKAEQLAGVGCESCHGPGGGVKDLKKEIKKEKRKYKIEELTALGMIVPTEETCLKCHTEDHPTFDAEEKFDYEKFKVKGLHEMEAQELR